MKKDVEIAFAIALVLLAILATAFPNEIVESITYAVILPSFILTLISFASEIMIKCEGMAEALSADTKKLSDLANELAETEKKSYEAGGWKQQYVEGLIPSEIFEKKRKSVDYLRVSLEYVKSQELFLRMRNVCNGIAIAGYVLLFLSLSLSPIIVTWLSVVNLNSVTLWSLAVLYVTLELKEDLCNWLFRLLHKRMEKKLNIEIKSNGDIVNRENCMDAEVE